ncbi:MAG: hypothetical protein ACI9YU_002339 [Flavobacteriales bacterium]|jgi:hypothetical protein
MGKCSTCHVNECEFGKIVLKVQFLLTVCLAKSLFNGMAQRVTMGISSLTHK